MCGLKVCWLCAGVIWPVEFVLQARSVLLPCRTSLEVAGMIWGWGSLVLFTTIDNCGYLRSFLDAFQGPSES